MNIISQAVIDQLIQDTSLELLPLMLASFIEELDRRQASLEEAIHEFQSGAWSPLTEAAHAIKSCTGTFGAELLYEKAMQLENASRDKAIEVIPQLIDDVKASLDKTHQAYSHYLASLS